MSTSKTIPARIVSPSVNSPLITMSLCILAVLGSVHSSNPLESVWTCILLLIILKWFWSQNTPGIMLYCMAIPFIEIHTTLLEANQANITLDELFFGTGRKTFWMSSLALLAVALGVRANWAMQSFKPNFSTIHSVFFYIGLRSFFTYLLYSKVFYNCCWKTISNNILNSNSKNI